MPSTLSTTDPTTASSDPDSAEKQREEEAQAEAKRSKETAAAVVASRAAQFRAGGLGGRGGAGNWRAGEDEVEQRQTGKERKEELERQVLKDVEVGLAFPGRAYLSGA